MVYEIKRQLYIYYKAFECCKNCSVRFKEDTIYTQITDNIRQPLCVTKKLTATELLRKIACYSGGTHMKRPYDQRISINKSNLLARLPCRIYVCMYTSTYICLLLAFNCIFLLDEFMKWPVRITSQYAHWPTRIGEYVCLPVRLDNFYGSSTPLRQQRQTQNNKNNLIFLHHHLRPSFIGQ